MKLKGKKVLVTGADGFIGSHLVEGLIQQGCAVRAFVYYNSFNSWGWLDTFQKKTLNSIEVFSGDIRDPHGVNKALKDIEVVFHLAALIGIPFSYHSPDTYVDTNIKGTLNILQAARGNKVKKIIHTSTSEVYGTAQFVPITEEHPINPQSPYAATKSAADFLAASFFKSFDLPTVIIRPFNTYGPRQSARAVIPTIITQILCGKRIIKLGSLTPTRDLTYVKDTVSGFIKAAESQKSFGEVINLGSCREISIEELAHLIAGIMHVEIILETDQQRKRPLKSEVERLLANTDKAKRLLDWEAKVPLSNGLQLTIDWLKSHKAAYKTELYNV